MSKSLLPVYKCLSGFQVMELIEGGVLLRSRSGFGRITALSTSVFRFQFALARDLLDRPSWAVEHTPKPAEPLRVEENKGSLRLRNRSGTFWLNLRSGAWKLKDNRANVLLDCPADGMAISSSGSQVCLTLASGEAIFGLGETTGTFNKRGLVREFWNIDVLGHAPAIHPSLRTLYVSIPFGLSLREGRAAGLFWDNPARQTWDVGQTVLDRWHMKALSPEIDLYLFVGPEVPEVVRHYTALTGRIPLPPMWALGYQQCRYSYETRQRVEEVARSFRDKRIPCDVIYLDIHHMDDYRVFTFGRAFPRPAELCARLRKQGFRLVTIVDPGVKDDSKFGVLRRGATAGAFVKAPGEQTDFVGKVWPGASRFPDFLNAKVREWWGKEQKKLQDVGITGFWNDMNEPANFGSDTKTLPEDCIHRSDFGPLSHAQGHNVYGMQMARASREGALRHRPHERPFVITRAGYAGAQRYALVWTGDNSSVWEHLADSMQMFLNLGLSGMAFCGGDVGGFLDNTTPELLTRWTQMAVFTPFLRNHSNIRTIPQEPWALGESTENICRRYIELRYQLLPYLYTLFAEARQTGAPVMRPLIWHYQSDPVAAGTGDQFLLGQDLLVCPVTRQGSVARCVYLPAGDWFDFWTGERLKGQRHVIAEAPLHQIPLYARAGALIPMGPVQQFVGEKDSDVLSLHVWPGNGHLRWYEDDGNSMDYERGIFNSRSITLEVRGEAMLLRLKSAEGSFPSKIKGWRIIVRGLNRRFRVDLNNRSVKSRFDPETRVLSFEIPNSPEEVRVRIR